MNVLMVVKSGVSRIGFVANKFAPEILLGGGIVGVAGAAVMATVAAPDVHVAVTEANRSIQAIDQTLESDPDNYTVTDAKSDKRQVFKSAALVVVKKYGPAVTLGALSVGSILTAYGIMKSRNLALAAAYKGLEQAYNKYRARVVEDHGEQYDRDVRHGVRRKMIQEKTTNAKGKEITVEKEVIEQDHAAGTSYYARYFTHGNPMFKGEFSLDVMYLRMKENELNSILEINGHLFLNEAYDHLGMPRTEAGQIMGWRKNNPNGDGYVSLGIFNRLTGEMCDWVDDPTYHEGIPVDFNVDSEPLFDKIENKREVARIAVGQTEI